ncbi:MAG TPA: diguanylate cyclase [Acidimicrobiales bacterium]|nr:diguanylate cyclase [Acidimicrobiales bacterium]
MSTSDPGSTGDQGEEPQGRDAASPVYALGIWLSQHPDALVASIGADGRPVPMPAAVPLLETHVIDDRSFLSLVAPQEATKVVNAFNDALRHGISVTRVRMAEGDGEVGLHYADVRDAYGVLLRLVLPAAGAGTAPVPAEELLPSRPRLAVIEKDDVSTIRAIDEATTALLGWSGEDMVGRPTLDFIHPDDHARAIDNWMEMIARGARHAVRLRYRCLDGTWRWLETSNELIEEADRRYVICQMIDISEEMAATEALRYSEQVLRRLAETVPVGLAEVAPDQTFRYVNASFRSLLSSDTVESVGSLRTCLGPEEAGVLERAVTAALESGSDADVDIRLPAGPGAPGRMCRVALRPVVDEGQVLGALICVMDVTDLKIQAATDPLTGLHNRSSIFEALSEAMAGDGPVGVVFLDLDNFKQINDSFGHDAGDDALTRLAEALRHAVRRGDEIGRVGGDEFVVVCRHVASPDDLIDLARRIQDGAVSALTVAGDRWRSSASVGVAWAEAGSAPPEEVVARADAAMYTAKRSPGQGPVLWSGSIARATSPAR